MLFITNSFKSHSLAKQKGLQSLTIHDFVQTMCQDYPALIDYLGFYEEEMEIETGTTIYEPHLDIDALTQGVKRGDFLQGKLSTDRNSPEEGF